VDRGRWVVALVLAATAAGALEVTGTVVDAAGAPVAGQVVDLGIWAANGVRLGRGRTGADGRFVATVPDGPAPTQLEVTAIRREELGWYRGPVGATVHLVLQPAVVLRGTLRDLSGAPVAHAEVDVQPDRGPEVQGAPAGFRVGRGQTTRTDDAGRFAVRLFPTGGAASVTITHEDYFPEEVTIARLGRDEPLWPCLRPVIDIAGRVLGPDGRPRAGVRVGAFGASHDGREALTDALGRYALRVRSPGLTCVGVTDPLGPVTAHPRRFVLARPGRTAAEVDLVAEAGLVVPIRVVDAATRRPLPDIAIDGTAPHGQLPHDPRLHTDARGEVRIRTVPGRLEVRADGGDRWLSFVGDERQVWLRAGTEPAPVVLELARPRQVAGVVRDDAGVPQPERTVALYYRYRLGDGDSESTTDAQGRFRLVAPPRGPVVLRVFARTRYPLLSRTLPAECIPAGEWALAVPRPALCDLRGRVVTGAGQPLCGVSLQLWPLAGAPRAPLDAHPLTTQTAADGSWRLERVPRAGTYRLSASLAAHRPREDATVPLGPRAVRDEPVVVPDIVLDPLAERIAGRVLDAAGRPVAEATVRVLGLRLPVARTAADGGFTCTGLPPGALRLLATHGADQAAEVASRAGDTDVVLRLQTVRRVSREEERKLAVELLRAAWAEASGPQGDRPSVARSLAQVDPEALTALLRQVKPIDTDGAATLTAGLVALADRAPRLCAEDLGLLDTVPAGARRALAQVRVGVALARTQPAAATGLLAAIQGVAAPGQATLAFHRAALAARLGRPDADSLADQACRALAGRADADRLRLLAAWLWADQPTLRARALHPLSGPLRYAGEMCVVAGLADHDPRAALARLDALWTPAVAAHWSRQDRDVLLLWVAAARLALALAPTDLAAAVRVAAFLPESERVQVSAMSAGLAADRAAAVALLRALANNAVGLPPEALGTLTCQAAELDPATGERVLRLDWRDLDWHCGQHLRQAATVSALAVSRPAEARQMAAESLEHDPTQVSITWVASALEFAAACRADARWATTHRLGMPSGTHRQLMLRSGGGWLAREPALRPVCAASSPLADMLEQLFGWGLFGFELLDWATNPAPVDAAALIALAVP